MAYSIRRLDSAGSAGVTGLDEVTIGVLISEAERTGKGDRVAMREIKEAREQLHRGEGIGADALRQLLAAAS